MKKMTSLLLIAATSGICGECPFLAPEKPCVSLSKDNHQTNVYTELSFLYWECIERGLDFGLKNTQTQNDESLTVEQPGFNFEPAFRIVLGTRLNTDWKIDATYSFFLHHLSTGAKEIFDLAGSVGPGILATWTSPGAFDSENINARWEYANTYWKIHANFIDLMIRSDLKMSPGVSFEPAFGVKFAILQHRYNVAYTFGNTISGQSLTSSTIHMNNRSLNIGPETACGLTWHLGRRWDLLGSLSGALLGSRFSIGRNETDLSTTQTDSLRNNYDFWSYRPQATARLGFRWSDCISMQQSKLHFALSASYEAQCWWKQNMFLRHYDAPIVQSPNLAASQGDVFFHGLDIDFLFDF